MYCKVPTCTREWLEIAKGFEERWNYSHVLGAIDGKHIVIQKPTNSGSHYFKTNTFNCLVSCCRTITSACMQTLEPMGAVMMVVNEVNVV